MKGTEKLSANVPMMSVCCVCVAGALISASLTLLVLVNKRGATNSLTLVQEADETDDSSVLKAYQLIPPRSARPAAHLTIKSSSKSNLQHMEWDSEGGLAITRNGMVYQNGMLVVPVSGQYYVYAQVYLGGRGCTQGNRLTGHVIKKYSKSGSGQGPVTLVGKTMRCQATTDDTWLQTSHVGGMFMLEQGDQLFVQVSNLTYLSIDANKNFFGILLW